MERRTEGGCFAVRGLRIREGRRRIFRVLDEYDEINESRVKVKMGRDNAEARDRGVKCARIGIGNRRGVRITTTTTNGTRVQVTRVRLCIYMCA